MPTYSYLCTECAHEFDIHQSFTDDSLTVCPACGGVLRKVFSPVGVTFSGSGFYRTDSREQPSGRLPAHKSNEKSGGKEGSAGKDSSGQAKPSTGTDSGSGGAGSGGTESGGTDSGGTGSGSAGSGSGSKAGKSTGTSTPARR